MIDVWFSVGLLAAESQHVICLRLAKLACGGRSAFDEAQLTVFEKIESAQHAAGRMLLGDLPESIVAGYRKTVQANATRLSL